MTNPMQVALLDSVFRASLHAREIPAQTGVCYTIMGKTTYSSADTSFCSSFTPLKEIVFGPRVIVLRAFARIPVSYIASEVFVSNIL